MKMPLLSESSFYRHRYIVGYGAYLAVLCLMLLISIEDVPRGISEDEATSAVQSATLSIGSMVSGDIVNAPYHLLQKLSLHYVGLTPLGIRLPSVVLALGMGLVLAVMLRQWFRTNVAVLTGLLTATSVPFLTTGRVGAPLIMGAFWMACLLLCVTNALHDERRKALWLILSVVIASLSLYTPLMIVPLIALGAAGLLHPHVRFVIRKMSLPQRAVAIGALIILLAPIVWGCIATPQNIVALLGVSGSAPSISELLSRPIEIVRGLFGSGTAPIGSVAAPALGYALAMLIVFGLLKSFQDRHSARSYMLFIWLAMLVPIVAWQPTNLIAAFIPGMLLLAIGLEAFIDQWYSLFPRNPYARVTALIPLAVLLTSACMAGITQYLRSQTYAPAIASQYSHELSTVRDELDRSITPSSELIVPEHELAFYDLLERDYDKLDVRTGTPDPNKKSYVLHPTETLGPDEPTRLVTGGTATNALILSVYR